MLFASGALCVRLSGPLSSTSLEEAREALAKREGLPSTKNATFWTGEGSSGHHDAELVEAWANKFGFAGVVWTGLPPKSPITEQNNDHPSIEDVISHLGGLSGHSAVRAEEYVRKAPGQIATAFRTRIVEEFGWDGMTHRGFSGLRSALKKLQRGIGRQDNCLQGAAIS